MSIEHVQRFSPGLPQRQFRQLQRVFPSEHFARLQQEQFRFYRTTFWWPFDRAPQNVFESVIDSLKALASPSSAVIGAEWWFSVLLTNATPQWLLPYHFDRNDLEEKDVRKLKHPERSSVLFLNAVPYGELVITDQVLTEDGARPRQPTEMQFIRPKRNSYVVFPGHLYHGVIGRLWRPMKETQLRVTMAVNFWRERPNAAYMRDSSECMRVFRLG
jgi:hypothetical protein